MLIVEFIPSYAEHSDLKEPIHDFLSNYGALLNVIVFSTGIAVGIFLAGRQFKLGLKGLQIQAYHKLRSEHTEKKNRFISDETLRKLIRLPDESELDVSELSSDEKKKIIAFYVTELNLYEQIKEEYNKGKIPAAEWIQWQIWIEKINSPLLNDAINQFRYVFEQSTIEDFTKFFVNKDLLKCKFCKQDGFNLEKLFLHYENEHPRESYVVN